MNWSLAFAPLIPAEALIALGVVVLALVIPGMWRGLRGARLRAVAALALMLALANPVLFNEDREPLSTVVAVVVDKSASQGLGERAKTTQAALAALKQKLATFRGVEVRTVESATSGDGPPVDGTELFAPLAAALGDVPPERVGAVIMLTDGEVHDIPADRSSLPAGAPLHALISGRDDEFDRRIVIDAAPRFGIVNEPQTVTFRVLDDGSDARANVRVTITRDGDPLSVMSVTPGVATTMSVDIPHAGPNVLEFEAEALAGELTPVNNRAAVEIEGVRENLRVLLVSGEPHAGERTWRNLLKSDASVDLVHFTILRPPEKQDGTPINQLSLIAFPTRELFSEKIDQFDLIIFDRYQNQGVLPLLYFDNIARYVRAGGALLVAAGPDFASENTIFDTPLAPVLPVAPTGKVIEEPYYARLTDLGERHPVTRDLDGANADPPHWSRFFRLVDVDRRPAGEVIMKGAEDKPLLVLNREDKGRVAMLLSDNTWLWARGYEGGGPHVDLLRRLAHWLMKEPDLEEEAIRATARNGLLTITEQTMADAATPVTVHKPSGASETVTMTEAEPGLWRTTIKADEIGLWRVEEGDRRAFVHVGAANPREFADARSTEAPLTPLVTATGGHIGRMADNNGNLTLPRLLAVRADATATAGRDWIGIRTTDASVLKGISRVPVFTGFLGLFGVAGLFGLLALLGLPFAAWVREGR